MKICVVGGLGNMGSRYCTILKHLGVETIIHDVGVRDECIENCSGIIIATPTDMHFRNIQFYKKYKLPFLVEKPLTKNFDELIRIVDDPNIILRMINQYEYFELVALKSDSKVISCFDKKPFSEYNYFKTGKDGLFWDCLNIIGLAKGTFTCQNNSPIWTCILNGKTLDYGQIDQSYIWNISDWLDNFDDNRLYALEAHERVLAVYGEMKK